MDEADFASTAQSSKLSIFPNYKAEYLVNCSLLSNAVFHHQERMESDLSEAGIELSTADVIDKIYINYRLKDVLISVTDDLLRYAMYHDIKAGTKRANGDEVFSIAEPVRASFFAKWILKLRPSIADALLPADYEYVSFHTDKPQQLEKPGYRIEFCNETLALIASALILKIPHEDGSTISGYDDLFHARELSTLLYSLRYRVAHQDVYTPVFYKLYSYHE